MPVKFDGSKNLIDFTQVQSMLNDKGYSAVCGVDEVGRGPLAGPVVAAAVIMPGEVTIDGLTDSKKLSAAKREQLFEQIVQMGLVCSVGIMDNECIDRVNILKASLLAMRRAVTDLEDQPDFILVDGNFPIPRIDIPQFSIVGGDLHCSAISAASIVAKVTRDRIMDRYDDLYRGFSFSSHKGYPTPAHLDELRRYGPCDIHRRSFKPVAELVQEQYALV